MRPILFENTYAALPERFYQRIHPEQAPIPELIRVNEALAEAFNLDIDWLRSADGVAMFSGSRLPESSQAIAMAYAGHQFGGLSPQLGDGRAHLLGELVDSHGVRFDVHLKGSGRTAFSRRGDGKAALGPVLREYIVSEAFAALGIPATRTLAAVLTGEHVFRDGSVPGAVLTRMAQSHVRVGTFQYFAIRNDREGVTLLADYVIERHFPELQQAENPYLALFEAVALRQAELIARWMGIGFIHGVMNTDNMQVVGETIDFGPCAFMDRFHPDKVFSSIDAAGRYAWNRQSRMAKWNLARLAEALLPLIDADQTKAIAAAEAVLAQFSEAFRNHYVSIFSAKLGVAEADENQADNEAFIRQTLSVLADNAVDFTLFFRHLTQVAAGAEEGALLALFADAGVGSRWLELWRQRLADRPDREAAVQLMKQSNPIYIPRNHRVEQVIEQAQQGNFAPFHELVDLLSHPFDEQPGFEHYELPPEPHEEVQETFCGT
ncbi:protein adenylyltransferase SelO [Mariprofundus ferrooxydans]|uniref:protein adenylyltransferase SelO n=1 Tax=Mariprofundus ferrooxydans TaxID=314344 RepID=UPI0014322557|nr:YdiU family protein [Mariprofundus ferrooxydans]